MTIETPRTLADERRRLGVFLIAPALVVAFGTSGVEAQLALDTTIRMYYMDRFDRATQPRRLTDHVAADFDADGDVDVAHSYGQGFFDRMTPQFSVAMNRGDGSFETPQFFPSGGWDTSSIVAADFNSDGAIDVALGRKELGGGPGVIVALNDGTGRFGSIRQFATGEGPSELVAADFDGDGAMDIATVNDSGRSLTLLRNDGTGQFGREDLPFKRGASITAGDLTGDGRPELIAAGAQDAGRATVFLNDGAGNFRAGPELIAPGAVGQATSHPAIGDVDGNGAADVLLDHGIEATTENRFTLHRNLGGGSFAPPELLEAPVTWNSAGLQLVDVDEDGALDIVSVGTQNQATFGGYILMPGVGDGTFGAAAFFDTGREGMAGVTAVDVTGDGARDMLISSGFTRTLAVHARAGGGFMGFQAPQGPRVGIFSDRLATGDLDGDGDLDVMTAYSTEVYTLLNDGAGNLAASAQPFPLRCKEDNELADLDGDGDLDAAMVNDVSCPPYHFYTLRNDGSGTFGDYREWPLDSPGRNEFVLLDYDDDGDIDAVVTDFNSLVGSTSGPVVHLLDNLGDGTFAPARVIMSENDSAWRIDHADFDRDGRDDLVLSHVLAPGGDSVAGIMRCSGPGDFELPVPYSPEGLGPLDEGIHTVEWVRVGDFNADGWPDVAYAGSRAEEVAPFELGPLHDVVGVMLNDGAGGLMPGDFELGAQNFELVSVQYGIDVVDANADGNLDIVIGTIGGAHALYFAGNGDGTIEPGVAFGVDGAALEPRCGDFNGDGVDDVAVVTQRPFGVAQVIVLVSGAAGGCDADCDGSGSLDFFDFLCFQNLFAAGDPEADCDGSGSLDFFDFLCFQNAFAAGCP